MTDRLDASLPNREFRKNHRQNNSEGRSLTVLAEILEAQGNPIRTICYAGCGKDSTPGDYIPNAHITYIDPDPVSMRELHPRSNDSLHVQTLQEYVIEHPGAQFDLVYLLNSDAPDKESVALVRNGGMVVVNNWLEHAKQFNSLFWKKSGLILTGILVKKGHDIQYITKHPEHSLEYVQNDMELQSFASQLEPDVLDAYEKSLLMAVPKVIRAILQSSSFQIREGEDLVAAYVRYSNALKEKQKRELQKLGIPEDLDIPLLYVRPDGYTVPLPVLPTKIAHVVLWVFNKQQTL